MPGLWKKVAVLFGKTDKKQPPVDDILNPGDNTKIIIALSECIYAKIEKIGRQNLTAAERTFDCIYWLEAEVNNGGFHQYFFNTAGDHAQETIGALQEIGANYTAGLLQQAMSVFPGQAPLADRYERQEQLLDKIGEEGVAFLNELDQKFYAYTDPIGALLVDYVKKHKEQF
jgi:hypothetical protein